LHPFVKDLLFKYTLYAHNNEVIYLKFKLLFPLDVHLKNSPDLKTAQ